MALLPDAFCDCGCGEPVSRYYPGGPKPRACPDFREGHNPEIASHLPAVAEPHSDERCILCAAPANKVVLGPIERESGLRRRTPVCTKCANVSGRPERRMVS